jgi:hypothetical protein
LKPVRTLSLALALLGVGSLLVSTETNAFPHVVQEKETLAELAERYYGRVQNERILVVANGLDRGTVATIVPGMLLEIPALTHYRVRAGDSWQSLGKELLGAPERGEYLAQINDQKLWIPPEPGRILRVPYNLPVVSTGQDSLPTLAYRYLGSTKQAYALSRYNRLEERKLTRGDLFLVPVVDLELTPTGEAAARRAALALSSEAAASVRSAQLRVEDEIPALIADVRGGRYVNAVARGVRLLAKSELSNADLGRIHRQLLEAYVALDAVGPAVESCTQWLRLDARADLNPVYLSPKILDACARVPKAQASETEPEAEAVSPFAFPATPPKAPSP